jgi:hypothetical protein
VDSRLNEPHGRDGWAGWCGWGLTIGPREHEQRMDLRRPLAALLLAGALAGCSSTETGGNTDVDRNEQDCGTAEQAPGQGCEESEDAPTEGG